MIERGFCSDDVTGLLNANSQMHGYQNHYSNTGHFGQMYPQNQRPSFAIQELLGLGNSTCRQNTSPDHLESQSISPGNFMYISREFPSMYSHGHNNYSTSGVHQDLNMNQSYINTREPTPQHQPNPASPFCPWRFDSLSQPSPQNQPLGQPVTPGMMPTSRHTENVSYNYKMSQISEQGKCLS